MAKSNHAPALLKNQNGQISIFFSASLIVLISIIAFVINIGLFVKAKINLQNATDAAAFSGAAVQARQLTKIAYLNWEMRNIYKEWMYKYYVIGNLNIKDVANPQLGDPMSFRLQNDRNAITGGETKDQYNIPAVCIHIAGSLTNICKRYSIPGLPEFGSSNLPGAEEASRAFMDTLISTKVNDCVDRTRFNMLVATTWTYNVLSTTADESIKGRAPAILSDRQGAWPKAVELAMRIRNLEFAMNRPPLTGGVCSNSSGTANIPCSTSITDIMAENKLGNERIVKAYYSGYRNIGNGLDEEMKETFKLTELPPKDFDLGDKRSASYLLVPQSKIQTYKKPWVDLKLMMVNYAIFYAAMIPRADTQTSGACDISKVAIPVPGYPLGFYKNPDVVTYYAVKGESDFVGMFNPFSKDAIKLTAYAAAKPFGGRIGPMLFTQRPGSKFFQGRTDNNKYRSVPYISSIDFVGTKKRSGGTLGLGEFEPGVPLPINSDATGYFWLKNPDSPLGGLIDDASGIQFGIPNLVYDFDNGFSPNEYAPQQDQIHKIFTGQDESSDKNVGLFSSSQFSKFKGSALSDTVSPEILDEEIARVRAPTRYEAANYLIPSPQEFNTSQRPIMDSFGFIGGQPTALNNGILRYNANIYAPLYRSDDQVDTLWQNPGEVTSTIFEFMREQKTGMDKYKMALNQAARTVRDMPLSGAQQGSASGYLRAANGISDIDFSNSDPNQSPGSCQSIAGQFLYFYYGDTVLNGGAPVGSNLGCPKALPEQLQSYFSKTLNDPNYNPSHYNFAFSWPKNYTGTPAEGLKMFTAYKPGPLTGVSPEGIFDNPIPGSSIQENMHRNFYSTKLVTINSLRGGPGYAEEETNFVIYSEGDVAINPGQDGAQTNFLNVLDLSAFGDELDQIKY
ncbi:MAG TPA: Tad domain-containing protein [Bacteriovoracaceae bacterium]|nr:Tad domain-containing protein [Bacteriovoracaceae bacterium]